MSNYNCPICNKVFFRYTHWENHLSRKSSCLKPFIEEDLNINTTNTDNINTTTNLNKCKYCNKEYSRYDSLQRHINNSPSCKNKKEFDDIKTLNANENKYDKYPISIQLIDMIFDKNKKIEELKNKIDNNKKLNNIIASSETNINKMKESSKLILNDIVIIARKEDNFINATQLCKAGNKLFADWYRMDSTKELIKELENCETQIRVSQKAETRIPISQKAKTGILTNSKNCDMGIPISQNPKMGITILKKSDIENDEPRNDNILISTKSSQNPDMGIPISVNSQDFNTKNQISNNSDIEIDEPQNDNILNPIINNKNSDMQICTSQNSKFVKINKGNSSKFTQGTWIHPDLAIQLAQWISPKFALQVSKWIRTLFVTGSVSFNNQLLEEKEYYLNELKLKDNQIQLLKNSFLKKQYRMDYPEKNVIYMLTNEDNKNKRIYIIGKATNLKERLSSYNKTSEHEVVYYKSCIKKEYMKTIEEMILLKLEIYREQANRDRFILPENANITLFTNIINDCINYIIPTPSITT